MASALGFSFDYFVKHPQTYQSLESSLRENFYSALQPQHYFPLIFI